MLHDRHNEILLLLTSDRMVKAKDLVERFRVSMETIRRDLDYLARNGYITRVHGGAVVKQMSGREPDYALREIKNHQENAPSPPWRPNRSRTETPSPSTSAPPASNSPASSRAAGVSPSSPVPSPSPSSWPTSRRFGLSSSAATCAAATTPRPAFSRKRRCAISPSTSISSASVD